MTKDKDYPFIDNYTGRRCKPVSEDDMRGEIRKYLDDKNYIYDEEYLENVYQLFKGTFVEQARKEDYRYEQEFKGFGKIPNSRFTKKKATN